MGSKKQTANKQEKRAKKEKKAKEQADKIIAEARESVKGTPKTKYDSERKEGVTNEAWLLGVQVRELREEGEPWWAIAKALELEGAGDSATTGKKGAARARTAYRMAFGDFPRTFQRGAYKGKAEQNEHVREMKKKKRSELKAQALLGKSIIDPTLSDEEIAEMLKGRRIKWLIKDDVVCPEGLEQEAHIHPKTPFYVFEENGSRCIEFRERDPRAPIAYRMIPGRTRTVRVAKIFSVR